MVPQVLGFRGEEVRERARPEVGQGDHTTWPRGKEGGRATTWCGPPEPLLGLPFWLPRSSGKIGVSIYLLLISDLRKYGVLTVLFPAEFRLR